jgi:hypothetical protein
MRLSATNSTINFDANLDWGTPMDLIVFFRPGLAPSNNPALNPLGGRSSPVDAARARLRHFVDDMMQRRFVDGGP